MISVELARQLAQAGVLWEPSPGERFTIDQPNVVGEVFWISHLTIDVHTFQGQPLLGFNGTTEWALDSVALEDALWLPREAQLRSLLGGTFHSLERVGEGYRLRAVIGGETRDFEAADATDAYAEALCSLLQEALG